MKARWLRSSSALPRILPLCILSQLPDLVPVQVSVDGFIRPTRPAGLLGLGCAEVPAAPLRAWARSVRGAGRRRRRKRGHSLASGEAGRSAAVPGTYCEQEYINTLCRKLHLLACTHTHKEEKHAQACICTTVYKHKSYP